MLTSDQNRKINEIVEEFKEAADFYRMEYSEDLMGMFRDFGCMLLLKCKVDTEGKADLERLLEGRHKLKGTVKRQLMTVSEELVQLWAPGEQDGSGDTGEYEGSQNVREMFQTALEEIFHFCLYSKGGKNRYLLPEETAKPLLRLLTFPEGMMAGNEGLVVLDTQCGAGSALMAASRYLKNLRLMGYEKDEEMWAAAVIMSQLSGLEMELHLEDGARADLYESCDLVISNPVYGTDTIKDEELIDQLPGELKTVRGRYHMELIRSMQALNFDGKAMLIVPNSFLFANRTESMKVRKWLLQSYSLEAIISLPEDTFMYSGVRSGVMVFSKPFMSGGWEGHTQRVLYYNLEKQEDKEKQQKEYERLEEVWSQRDSYYGKWERSRREKTVENRNGIKVPANWQYNSFWFADVDQIEAGKWNLLPENYRPEEQINLEIEDPALLLQEMLREQEEITKELKELLKEVM